MGYLVRLGQHAFLHVLRVRISGMGNLCLALQTTDFSVSAEYLLVPQMYHNEEEVPARQRLVVTDW